MRMMTREHPHMIKRAYSIHFMIGAKTYRMSKTQKDQVSLPYYEYHWYYKIIWYNLGIRIHVTVIILPSTVIRIYTTVIYNDIRP